MKRQAIFVRIITTLLALVSTHLFSQQTPEREIAQIVAQSQQALSDHNEQKALSIIQQGLIKFPNREELQAAKQKVQMLEIDVKRLGDVARKAEDDLAAIDIFAPVDILSFENNDSVIAGIVISEEFGPIASRL